MSAFLDDIALQGIATGMIYGFVFDPPWGPSHKCPGCQVRPVDSENARFWDRWHYIDKKYPGEASACPVIRGEKVTESYTNEQRKLLGHNQIALSSIDVPKLQKTENCNSFDIDEQELEVNVEEIVSEIFEVVKRKRKPKIKTSSSSQTGETKSKKSDKKKNNQTQ